MFPKPPYPMAAKKFSRLRTDDVGIQYVKEGDILWFASPRIVGPEQKKVWYVRLAHGQIKQLVEYYFKIYPYVKIFKTKEAAEAFISGNTKETIMLKKIVGAIPKQAPVGIPDRWMIAITPENIEILREWKTKHGYTTNLPQHGYMCSSYNNVKGWRTNFLKPGYQLITTEYFKKNIYSAKAIKKEPVPVFTLPEKWAVKVTEQNVGFLNKWRKLNGNTATLSLSHMSQFNGFVLSKKSNVCGWWVPSVSQEYTVITTEEFLQYVLKEKPVVKVGEPAAVNKNEDFNDVILTRSLIFSVEDIKNILSMNSNVQILDINDQQIEAIISSFKSFAKMRITWL